MTLEEFTDYCASFYHSNKALYPMYRLDIRTLRRICEFYYKSPNYQGDSFDRELVRHALEDLGYREVEK